MKQEEIELLVWKYIDGDCNPQEQEYISKMIREDATWKNCYALLSSLNQTIAHTIQPQTPGPQFAENIMNRISPTNAVPVKKQYINKWVIKSIAAFFIISIAALVVYAILHAELNEPSYTFDYGNLFNPTFINLFIFANIILGLMLLDSIFRRRMKSY